MDAVEKHKEIGIHELKAIASKLRKKCVKVEKSLSMEHVSLEERIKKALKILSS